MCAGGQLQSIHRPRRAKHRSDVRSVGHLAVLIGAIGSARCEAAESGLRTEQVVLIGPHPSSVEPSVRQDFPGTLPPYFGPTPKQARQLEGRFPPHQCVAYARMIALHRNSHGMASRSRFCRMCALDGYDAFGPGEVDCGREDHPQRLLGPLLSSSHPALKGRSWPARRSQDGARPARVGHRGALSDCTVKMARGRICEAHIVSSEMLRASITDMECGFDACQGALGAEGCGCIANTEGLARLSALDVTVADGMWASALVRMAWPSLVTSFRRRLRRWGLGF